MAVLSKTLRFKLSGLPKKTASATGAGMRMGSVCLRLHDSTGDCEDSGSWAVDGDFICYDLEWWGEVYGQRDACINVVAHEGKPYEVLYQDGPLITTMFHFTLLE
jgi:hypothetical protein